jgi:exonuclease SbcD
METDEFLTAREHKEIHDAHNGIIFLIPKVKNLQSSENSAKEIDLTKDITTLFREYFVSAKKQEPNEEIMNLFKEILESQ